MLFAPPLEIIDLIEDVYDNNGNFVGEKINDSATLEQEKIFEMYQKECEEALRTSFRVELSDRTYNPVDGWKIKYLLSTHKLGAFLVEGNRGKGK